MGSLDSGNRFLRERVGGASTSISSTLSHNNGSSSTNGPPLSDRRPLNNAKTDVIATIETLPDNVVKVRVYLIEYTVSFLSLLLTVPLPRHLCFDLLGGYGRCRFDGGQAQLCITSAKQLGVDLECGGGHCWYRDSQLLLRMLSQASLPRHITTHELVPPRIISIWKQEI